VLAVPSDILSDALDHPMIIQTFGLDPSRAGWTESASDLSSRDPSGAIQVDAEHPSRNRTVDLGFHPHAEWLCHAAGGQTGPATQDRTRGATWLRQAVSRGSHWSPAHRSVARV
jgi:hypothetical protein